MKIINTTCLVLFSLISLNGQIVINEINYNPPEAGQDHLEYIELYNPGVVNVNIKDWIINDAVDIVFPDTFIRSNGYLVICVNTLDFDTAYGFPAMQWDGGALRNDSEIITLKDQNGDVVDSVRYSDSGGWPNGPDGNGSSLELCRANIDNYRSEYWKSATNPIGKKINGFELRGSPGQPNSVSCADATIDVRDFRFNSSNIEIFVGQHVEWFNALGKHNVNGSKDTYPGNPEGFINGPAATGNWTFIKRFDIEGDYKYRDDQNPTTMTGMIKVRKIDPNYPSYPISLISTINAEGTVDSANVRCTLEGIVYGVNFRPAGLQFTLIDAFNDGIVAFHSNKNFSYTVNQGDKIKVKGIITQFNGLTEIVVDTINLISVNNTLVNPLGVALLNESTESQLVKLKNVSLVSPNQWTNNPLGFTVKVTDGVNIFDVRIDNDCDLVSKEAPAGKFDITGLGYQNDITSPFTEGYQLYPRYTSDINPYIPQSKFYNKLDIAKVRTINSNGDLDSLKTKCEIRGIVYGIDYDGSPGLQFTLIDNTAGITVIHPQKLFNYKVTEGDEIIVRGIIDQFNGQAQIVPDTIVLLTEKNVLKPPRLVTQLDESTESDLIKIADVTIVDQAEWIGSGNSFNVRISDGSKEMIMRIDNDCDLSKTTSKGKRISVTGLGNQFDNEAPFTGGYQIWPRYAADISYITLNEEINPSEKIFLVPNPIHDYIEFKNIHKNYNMVEIFSLEGKRIISTNFKPILDIALEPGIYILKLKADHTDESLKLIVE